MADVSQAWTNGLIRCSCILSMLGALFVAFSWGFPIHNRKKHGRILLLWLSFADFMSSFVYFLTTLGDYTNNRAFCETTALLDIFFPVASFLWTDFIAYYLYLVVKRRSQVPFDWKRLLATFHIVAWSGSFLVLLLVLLTGHAGSDKNSSKDDDLSTTGGWCWIEADSRKERFIWELIGGKLVEWISGLIVVPFLYTSVAMQLYRIDQRQIKYTGETLTQSAVQSPMTHPTTFKCEDEEEAATSRLEGASTADNDMFPYSGNDNYSEGNGAFSRSGMSDALSLASEHKSEKSARKSYFPRSLPKAQFFNQFYFKLAILPLVFIFIRFWSSLRVILVFAGKTNEANNSFLVVMQAFFDPSQGFFNSLLFVFFSSEDRQELFRTLSETVTAIKKHFIFRVASIFGFRSLADSPGNNNNNKKDVVSIGLTTNLREQLVSSQSSTPLAKTGTKGREAAANDNKDKDGDDDGSTIDIKDLEGDFECDDSNRLSDFSFDSRMD